MTSHYETLLEKELPNGNVLIVECLQSERGEVLRVEASVYEDATLTDRITEDQSPMYLWDADNSCAPLA